MKSLIILFNLIMLFTLTYCSEQNTQTNNQDIAIYQEMPTVYDQASLNDEHQKQADTICEPAKAQCKDDKVLQTCSNDGMAWQETICNYKCIKGECKNKLCEPGSKKCKDSRILMLCSDDGTEVKQEVDCSQAPVCLQNNTKCICKKADSADKDDNCAAPPKCNLGTKVCDTSEKFAKTCVLKDNAPNWKWEPCDYGCKDGKCLEAVCDKDEVKCSETNPNLILECSKDQTSWEEVLPECSHGCKKGSCISYPCETGEKQCNWHSVEICKPDHSGFVFSESCGEKDCVQEGTNAFCVNCTQGSLKCDGDTIMKCADQQVGWTKDSECSGDNHCVQGECYPGLVLVDDDYDYEYTDYQKLGQAIINCWNSSQDSYNKNVLCNTIDTSGYTFDISSDDFIDSWYCYYNESTSEYENPDNFPVSSADKETADTLFNCGGSPKINFKKIIPGSSDNELCIWFDTFFGDTITIDICSNFSEK